MPEYFSDSFSINSRTSLGPMSVLPIKIDFLNIKPGHCFGSTSKTPVVDCSWAPNAYSTPWTAMIYQLIKVKQNNWHTVVCQKETKTHSHEWVCACVPYIYREDPFIWCLSHIWLNTSATFSGSRVFLIQLLYFSIVPLDQPYQISQCLEIWRYFICKVSFYFSFFTIIYILDQSCQISQWSI